MRSLRRSSRRASGGESVYNDRRSNRTGLKLFRAAAYVLVALALVHAMSLFAEQSPADAAEAQVLNLMKSYTSNIMGTPRTYWQFLYGFSMSFSIFCFAAGVLSPMVSRALDWHALRRVAAFNACWLV